MNISNMPAGREMDLRIAREVFGLTKPSEDRNELGSPFDWERRDDGTWCGANIICDEAEWWNEVEWPPEYSADIAAAWEIVGIFTHGWNGHATVHVRVDQCLPPYWCRASIEAPGLPAAKAWADTVPLAICRAALMVAELCKENE